MADEVAPQVRVTIENAAAVRRLMREAAPEFLKELDKANREAAKPILAYAKGLVPDQAPISGWQHNGRTGWNSANVQKGIVARAGKRSSFADYRSLLEFRQMDTAGAIFEVLGRKSRPTSEKGQRFLTVVENRFPRVSRILWRAVDDIGLTTLQHEIVENYKTFEAKLNMKLESADGN